MQRVLPEGLPDPTLDAESARRRIPESPCTDDTRQCDTGLRTSTQKCDTRQPLPAMVDHGAVGVPLNVAIPEIITTAAVVGEFAGGRIAQVGTLPAQCGPSRPNSAIDLLCSS